MTTTDSIYFEWDIIKAEKNARKHRDFGNTIRIISARKATKTEAKEYRRLRGK